MHFKALMKNLGIEKTPGSWERYYREPKDSFLPAEQLPGEKQIAVSGEKIGFPDELLRDLIKCRNGLADNEAYSLLWSLWKTVLFDNFDSLDVNGEHYSEWPLPPGMDEPMRDLFRVLVLLSNYDEMRFQLGKRDLAETEQYAAANFAGCVKEHYQAKGYYGLSNDMMWWIRAFMLGRLFRIGILEFEIIRYSYPYTVFSRGGIHKALCSGDNLRFNKEGYPADNGSQRPVLKDEDELISGWGFNSSGLLNPEMSVLKKGEWETALQHGDYVLNIHIPGDGKLSPEAVADSLNKASAFFKKHFPEISIAAMICYTWLLDTSLKNMLPEGSNILSYQKLFTIIMDEPDSQCLFDYIFRQPECPLDQLIPKNSFQENILSFVKQGGVLRGGFGYMLTDQF